MYTIHITDGEAARIRWAAERMRRAGEGVAERSPESDGIARELAEELARRVESAGRRAEWGRVVVGTRVGTPVAEPWCDGEDYRGVAVSLSREGGDGGAGVGFVSLTEVVGEREGALAGNACPTPLHVLAWDGDHEDRAVQLDCNPRGEWF